MLRQALMLLLCAGNFKNQPTTCRLGKYDFRDNQPVILRNNKLLEPDEFGGHVIMSQGDSLTLSCENGGGTLNHPKALYSLETATITCDRGDEFRNDDWLNGSSEFSSFYCDNHPVPTVHKSVRTCFANNSVYEVGYTVLNTFNPLYESCYDEANVRPIYSKYTQKPYNHNFQTRVQRPFFMAGNVFDPIPMDKLFSPVGQKAAVAKRVGLSKINDYVTSSQLLSRGHLAAKTDFVYAFGQRATFHYLNCAPQWTGFNGGNWNTLEVDLRRRIHDAGYDTIIYTGTYGISSLDSEDDRVELFLYSDHNNNPVIPVPLYYYKVVYSSQMRRGTVFVGINDPYVSRDEARRLTFCRDVCRGESAFAWLSWAPDDISEGYSFCCTVPEFRDVVKHLPDFEVHGLLT